MTHTVDKFGGTSVADADAILKVRTIVRSDPRRRAVVVSAPAGVTNMLIAWATPFGKQTTAANINLIQECAGAPAAIFNAVRQRFIDIVTALGINMDIDRILAEIAETYAVRVGFGNMEGAYHYAISRGEFVNAQIVAAVLGYRFVDAASFIVLDERRQWLQEATENLAEEMHLRETLKTGFVVGGFYGRPEGTQNGIITFSRGGSDITGAIVASLTQADMYNNWTDVEGVLTADPRIVPNARKIPAMSYQEMLELADTGAKVLHPSAVHPVERLDIPIHVRCSRTHWLDGTLISAAERAGGPVTGIAHRAGESLIRVRKADMPLGFDLSLDKVLLRLNISFDHKQTGTNSMTIVAPQEQIEGCEEKLKNMLLCMPDGPCVDAVEIEHGYTMICVVGAGMRGSIGVAAKLFTALAEARVNVVTIDQGGSEINIVVGVSDADGPKAVQAIHDAFFP